MGLFDFLKSTMKPVIKNSPLDAVEVTQKKKWHCGVCGLDLELDDSFCPACGGKPVDQNGKTK